VLFLIIVALAIGAGLGAVFVARLVYGAILVGRECERSQQS
jgi:hypothetical protein